MSLQDYLEAIKNKDKKDYFLRIMNWINEVYPKLDLVIKWNQPMFVNEGVFIISFNASNNYISVTIEKTFLEEFREEINDSGFEVLSMVFHIKFTDELNLDLLGRIIDRIIDAKKECKGFWL